MSRRKQILLGGLLAVLVAGAIWADQKVALTLNEYRQAKLDSVSPEAYARALARIRKTHVGMRTDQFFDVMEMLIVRDKAGNGIDGFVEGYLQKESMSESDNRKPASVLIFGWYEEWKKRKKPVKKFQVVFRDKVLEEIVVFNRADDWRLTANGGPTR